MRANRTAERLRPTLRVLAGLVTLSLLAPAPAEAQSAVRFDGPALRDALRGLPIEPVSRAAQSDWRRVESLRPGTVISVVPDGRATVSGQFVSADAATVTLTPAGQAAPQTIRREEIVEVTGRISHRGSRLGAVVGAGAGAFVGFLAALNLAFKDCGGDCSDEKWLVGVSLVGIPVGGGFLGYYGLAGQPRVETIYRRTA